MKDDELAKFVILRVNRFTEAKDHILELRKRFSVLRGHQTIYGCGTWTAFCERELHISDRHARRLIEDSGENPAKKHDGSANREKKPRKPREPRDATAAPTTATPATEEADTAKPETEKPDNHVTRLANGDLFCEFTPVIPADTAIHWLDFLTLNAKRKFLYPDIIEVLRKAMFGDAPSRPEAKAETNEPAEKIPKAQTAEKEPKAEYATTIKQGRVMRVGRVLWPEIKGAQEIFIGDSAVLYCPDFIDSGNWYSISQDAMVPGNHPNGAGQGTSRGRAGIDFDRFGLRLQTGDQNAAAVG
jgi:hypothetical protein